MKEEVIALFCRITDFLLGISTKAKRTSSIFCIPNDITLTETGIPTIISTFTTFSTYIVNGPVAFTSSVITDKIAFSNVVFLSRFHFFVLTVCCINRFYFIKYVISRWKRSVRAVKKFSSKCVNTTLDNFIINQILLFLTKEYRFSYLL